MWRSLCLLLIAFLIVSCNKEDTSSIGKCGEVECLNGSTCVDNTCDCPPGLSGSSCETILTPTKILIRKVRLTNFPEKDSFNEDWDLDGLPDVFFQVYKEFDLLYDEEKTYQDAMPTESYDFFPTQLEITEVNRSHRIALFDSDFQIPDILGEIEFIPFDGKSHPKKLILGIGEKVTFRLELDYDF